MAISLMRGIAASNTCELQAVLMNEGAVAAALRRSGIRVVVLDERRLSSPRIVLKLRRFFAAFQPDIAHAHRYKENLVCYLATRKLRKAPYLIATQHGMPERPAGSASVKSEALRKLNNHILARNYARTVAVSKEMKSRLVSECGFESGKLEVVHNGIELPHTIESYREKAFIVGACGRLVPVKNYELFLRCAALVRNSGNGMRFLLAGDGPEREALKGLCRDLGLAEVLSMPGHLEDMDTFYRGIDVFVNTSWHEGIPMSVLEAMARGVPVVVPDVGGFPEIVDDGVDGFLLPEHAPELYAAKCLDLMTDPRKRESMAHAARRKIEERFSIARMAEDYNRLYRSIAFCSPEAESEGRIEDSRCHE